MKPRSSDTSPGVGQGDGGNLADQPYDRRRLSYAGTFTNPWQSRIIQGMELLTGKLRLLSLIRRFESMGVPHGQGFWAQALGVMGIDLTTPADEIARIPATGPVIVTANHPHGLVDGMILAELVGRGRTDYKILTRSLLTGVGEIEQFMIPVPFPHEDNALQKNLEMRKRAMAHLAAGGVIVLFPSGVVAASHSLTGPAIEAEWNPFTAKMIARSGATVVPIYFPGQNSRWYQMANRVSATLRQGLLLHEVVHALNRPQGPRVGRPIPPDEMAELIGQPRQFMAWLRDRTLSLGVADKTAERNAPENIREMRDCLKRMSEILTEQRNLPTLAATLRTLSVSNTDDPDFFRWKVKRMGGGMGTLNDVIIQSPTGEMDRQANDEFAALRQRLFSLV